MVGNVVMREYHEFYVSGCCGGEHCLKFVLALLLCMSLTSWAYMAGKFIVLNGAARRIKKEIHDFESAGELAAALPVLEDDPGTPLWGVHAGGGERI